MTKESGNKDKKLKTMNMNVKFPENDYRKLQKIADDLGGMTLSSLVRMLIYAKLEEVEKTGDPKSFLEFRK